MDFHLQSDQLCVDQKGQKHLFYDLQSQASRFQDCQDCVSSEINTFCKITKQLDQSVNECVLFLQAQNLR